MTNPLAVDPEPGWNQSLNAGAPGIMLLHIELARRGIGSWATVGRWATAMTRHQVSLHPSMGLFRGAPAVAFALSNASRPEFGPALETLDAGIRKLTANRLAAAHERIERCELPTVAEFDLISGLTGLGTYLLNRDHDSGTLRDVLSYLVRLTEPVPRPNGPVPGWWAAPARRDALKPQSQGGRGNLGMAHGISGPLALLSTAMRRAVTVPGQPEAIERICGWLDAWQQGTPGRPWWPEFVTVNDLRGGQSRAHRPQRPSWCYGAAGIARAMQLAGLALADRRHQDLAENALAWAITDDLQLARFSDASLCHGWAGLIVTVCQVAADAPDPRRLHRHVPRLLANMDQCLRDHPIDGDGLLEGAAGVALARLAAEQANSSPRWDACILVNA